MKTIVLLFFGTACFIGFWSIFIEPRLLTENVQKKQWSLPPMKIAFFSDLHAGAPSIDLPYVENLVDRINSHKPDLILIGGDLVITGVIGGRPIDFSEVAGRLRNLKAPLGKFAVLGNHDWWSGPEEIKLELQKVGINTLENQSVLISLNEGSSMNLVGIGDRYTGHSFPEKAFAKIETQKPSLVFMHDPASLFEIRNKFVVSFAGHTHGGQVFIPGLGALIVPGDSPKSWAKGWTQFELGSLYVSQGIGTSILPIRFNSPPEFLILNLERQ